MSIDVSYTRASGEEVRARLFPRPKRAFDEERGMEVDGPKPIPLPTGFTYRYQLDPDAPPVPLVFVPVRSIQQLGADPSAGVPPDAVVPEEAFTPDGMPRGEGWTIVVDVSAGRSCVVDLTLGGPLAGAEEMLPAVRRLLEAVAGVGG